ncbi:MAG: FtsX-like permease family protein [Anaerolineae bacterium]|nr:FtsX-like permease family protein [Anaerolineae bacterium]
MNVNKHYLAALKPRWRKVLRDLWEHKARTVLVVLAVSVGVFAFGILATSRVVLDHNLSTEYLAIHPASASLVLRSFDDDLIDVVRRLPEIEEAEGRRTFRTRLQRSSGEWIEFNLTAIADYEDMRVNQIWHQSGSWPPGRHEVLLERSVASYFNIHEGDEILIETSDDKQYTLKVAGLAHDLTQVPSHLIPNATGFVSFATLEWMGGTRTYNQLDIIVAGDQRNKAHIQAVASDLKKRLENDGYIVFHLDVPEPLQHPMASMLAAVNYLLMVLSAISYALSGFLIYNTMASIMAQQRKQIGIMKAVGGRQRQIIEVYLGLVFVFGVLALLVALPIGVYGAKLFCHYIANLINFDLHYFQVPRWVFAMQTLMALIAPVLAALYPIIHSARITVHAAITDHGIALERLRQDDLTGRLVERVRGLPRPVLLSLRNTFRRQMRLMLTLVPLAIAGATFIAVFGVRASLQAKIDETVSLYNLHLQIIFDRPYRSTYVSREAMSVPGVIESEAWATSAATIVLQDGTIGPAITLLAPPVDTDYIRAAIKEGRWLEPGDKNVLVVGEDLLNELPGYHVGDDIVLEIGGQRRVWQIVGKTGRTSSAGTGPGTGTPISFVNYDYLARIQGTQGYATLLAARADRLDTAGQEQIARALEEHFKSLGLVTGRVRTINLVVKDMTVRMYVLIGLMLLMAALLAVVGALGLTGTMSLNILERTREIGIMRAIGATNRSIRQIVIIEGNVIVLLSWAVGTVLSIPFTKFLSDAVGLTFLNEYLPFAFPVEGVAIWLGLSLVIATLASILPAQRASQISVREALAYE